MKQMNRETSTGDIGSRRAVSQLSEFLLHSLNFAQQSGDVLARDILVHDRPIPYLLHFFRKFQRR